LKVSLPAFGRKQEALRGYPNDQPPLVILNGAQQSEESLISNAQTLRLAQGDSFEIVTKCYT
jgi:hypothetical protein